MKKGVIMLPFFYALAAAEEFPNIVSQICETNFTLTSTWCHQHEMKKKYKKMLFILKIVLSLHL